MGHIVRGVASVRLFLCRLGGGGGRLEVEFFLFSPGEKRLPRAASFIWRYCGILRHLERNTLNVCRVHFTCIK